MSCRLSVVSSTKQNRQPRKVISYELSVVRSTLRKPSTNNQQPTTEKSYPLSVAQNETDNREPKIVTNN
jgi:hypothetical protein